MAAIVPAVAIGVAAGAEAENALRDGLQQLQLGGPVYLRDGQPESIIGKIGLAVGRHACRRYQAGNVGLTPSRAASYEKACRPYLDDVFGPSGPVINQPFLGGQCSEVYLVGIRVESPAFAGGAATFTRRTRGPILGVRISRTETNGTVQINSTAATVSTTVCGSVTAGAQGWRNIGVGGNDLRDGTDTSARIVSITPCGLDNCGNPPPEVEPGPEVTDPNPPPFVFAPDPTVNIIIDGELNIDGSLTFNIGTGPVTIDPFGDDDGGTGGGGDGGGGGSSGDGQPGSADSIGAAAFDGVPSEDGEDIGFGSPPDGSVWVGVLARVVAIEELGSIPGTAGANRVYPRVLGNLSLTYSGGRSDAKRLSSEWTQSFRPVTSIEVVGAFVNTIPGCTVTVFPVSARICPENSCGGEDG